jgi:voltage-gated potassium channel
VTHGPPQGAGNGDRATGPVTGLLRRWWHGWTGELERRPFVAAWQAVAVMTLTWTVLAGVLVRMTDPHAITSVWDGMWWAVQTVTTVGYGDTVPESPAGRVIATAVMLFGIAFITVSTAAMGSLFSDSSRRRRHRRHEDPVQEEVARLHSRLDEVVDELRELRSAITSQTSRRQPPASSGGVVDTPPD